MTPRSNWSVGPGEEARLTPKGPTTAVIISRGLLPLRARKEAGLSHQQPAFPGTTVLLGETRFEVLREEFHGEEVRYRLGPWPDDSIIRDEVVYGPALIHAVARERTRIEERESRRRWSWLLYPFVGLFPEDRQVRECDRLGLDDTLATFLSGCFEAVAIVGVKLALDARLGGTSILLTPLLAPFMFVAVTRAVGAIAFREIAGSPLFVLADRFTDLLRSVPTRIDPTILPLTRSAFWARLSLPDHHEREEGTWIVRGMLPHLSWKAAPRLRFGDAWWTAAPLPTEKQRGRLTYSYRLTLASDRDPAVGEPGPSSMAYQREVRDGIAREWEDLLRAFSWLVSLLPMPVQRRAMDERGGPPAIRGATIGTCVASAALSLWFGTGAGVFNLLTAMLLAVDTALRVMRLGRKQYAPSLLGGLIADYVRPERVAYHAHRKAEGETLARLQAAAQ